jgi:hypothetical protein
MRLKRKLIVLLAYAAASKHAIAASGATAVTAAVMSDDWVTWAVSGVGAVAYRLRQPEVKKIVSVSNGIISVFLGGLGAPWVVSVAVPGVSQPPLYLAAFLVALLWPYMWDKYMPAKKDES